MQIQIFRVGANDSAGVEEMNRFLRGHRVLSVDRHFENGVWYFCVCHQSSEPVVPGQAGAKVDYRADLDTATFAMFSRLREARKLLAEKEGLPPYALFTNEQLAEVARRLPRSLGASTRGSRRGGLPGWRVGSTWCHESWQPAGQR
jgi:hypothetical protein